MRTKNFPYSEKVNRRTFSKIIAAIGGLFLSESLLNGRTSVYAQCEDPGVLPLDNPAFEPFIAAAEAKGAPINFYPADAFMWMKICSIFLSKAP